MITKAPKTNIKDKNSILNPILPKYDLCAKVESFNEKI